MDKVYILTCMDESHDGYGTYLTMVRPFRQLEGAQKLMRQEFSRMCRPSDINTTINDKCARIEKAENIYKWSIDECDIR